MSFPRLSARAALVVAHPSHELRLHGWLEQTRPCVCVLTDGAGRSGEPRLTRTTEVLARAGATQGAIYGRFTDLEVYSAILNGDGELFARVVEELAEMFVEKRIEYVVGDAAEGYSVTHDTCRIMIGAAVEMAERSYGHRVRILTLWSLDHRTNALMDYASERSGSSSRTICSTAKSTRHLITRRSWRRTSRPQFAGEPFRGVLRFSQPQLAGQVDVEVSTAMGAEPALKENSEA